jgi:hypothetical protein
MGLGFAVIVIYFEIQHHLVDVCRQDLVNEKYDFHFWFT